VYYNDRLKNVSIVFLWVIKKCIVQYTNHFAAVQRGYALRYMRHPKSCSVAALAWRCYTLAPVLLALGACAAIPSGPTPPPQCVATQLRAHAGQPEAGMGHITRRIFIQNISHHRCVLAAGIPRLQLLTAQGSALQTQQQPFPYPGAAAVSTQNIVLRSAETVAFWMHYAAKTGYGYASCPWASAIALRLPGLTTPLHLVMRLRPYGGLLPHPTCGEISVTPLQSHRINPPSARE